MADNFSDFTDYVDIANKLRNTDHFVTWTVLADGTVAYTVHGHDICWWWHSCPNMDCLQCPFNTAESVIWHLYDGVYTYVPFHPKTDKRMD
jgi:hypothetical protein